MKAKALTLACAVAISATAHATDFYIGTGATQYAKPANGVYYQNGYPYKLELNATPTILGVAFQHGAIRYRVELNQLGQAHTMAMAESDGVYSGYAKAGATLVKLQGNGNVSGLLVSASKETTLGPGKFYGEAGLFAYRQNWKVSFYDSTGNYFGTASHTTQFDFRPFVGVGYRLGNVGISLRHFSIDSHRDGLPFVSGSANQIGVTVAF